MHQAAANERIGIKKKKSILKRIGMVILILFLLPFILAGLLYLYVNVADFQYDNPEQILSLTNPMSFSQRNSFDAAGKTRTVRLDNTDLYFLLEDKIPELRYNEAIYINAYRIALEDKAVYLQGKAYGINVPVKLDVDAGLKNGGLQLRIMGASLGRWAIPVPIELIAEKLNMDLEFTLSLQEHFLLKTASDLFIEEGYLKAIFSIDRRIVSEGIAAWIYLKPALLYQKEEDEMVMLVADLQNSWMDDQYTSQKLDMFLKELQRNPDIFQELKVKMLAAAPEKTAAGYFSSDGNNIKNLARFYPGITREAVEKAREELHLKKNYEFLKKYAFDIDEQFGNKTITIRKGRFINIKNNTVLDFNSFYADAPEAAVVFPEGTQFCAIYCEGADSKQKIGKVIYASGTAIQFINGKCAVLCKMNNNLYLNQITPQEYEDLASGKTSVYMAGIKDR